MSIFPLLLSGWDELSTWGEEDDYLYAQVTRNGLSDDEGPQFWITPPAHAIYRTVPELAAAVSHVTGVDRSAVLGDMAAGLAPNDRQRLDLPED